MWRGRSDKDDQGGSFLTPDELMESGMDGVRSGIGSAGQFAADGVDSIRDRTSQSLVDGDYPVDGIDLPGSAGRPIRRLNLPPLGAAEQPTSADELGLVGTVAGETQLESAFSPPPASPVSSPPVDVAPVSADLGVFDQPNGAGSAPIAQSAQPISSANGRPDTMSDPTANPNYQPDPAVPGRPQPAQRPTNGQPADPRVATGAAAASMAAGGVPPTHQAPVQQPPMQHAPGQQAGVHQAPPQRPAPEPAQPYAAPAQPGPGHQSAPGHQLAPGQMYQAGAHPAPAHLASVPPGQQTWGDLGRPVGPEAFDQPTSMRPADDRTAVRPMPGGEPPAGAADGARLRLASSQPETIDGGRGGGWMVWLGLAAVLVAGLGAAYWLTRDDGATDADVAAEVDPASAEADTAADDAASTATTVTTAAPVAESPTGEPLLVMTDAEAGPLSTDTAYPIEILSPLPNVQYQVVVDDVPQGTPFDLLPDLNLPPGRHSIMVEMIDGETVTPTNTVTVHVFGDAVPPAGYRANLASIDIANEGWAEAMSRFDQYLADGHENLKLTPSDPYASLLPGYWNIYVDGFGEDRGAAQNYCAQFELAIPDDCYPSYFDPEATG